MTRTLLKYSFLLLIIIGVLFGSGWYLVNQYINRPLFINKETIFTIPAGTGKTALVHILEEQNLIESPSAFLLIYMRLHPNLTLVKAGTYRLLPEMTVYDMLLLFNKGVEAQFAIRFTEGSRFNDWRDKLEQAPYLKQTITDMTMEEIAIRLGITEPSNVEGWLLPDTYYYTAETTDLAILKRAYQRMKKVIDTNWTQRVPGLPYKNSYEMLIMASIIEKETGIANERSKVASVFVNRLRANMPLQTDPTVIYGLREKYKNKLTRKDLTTYTPYNTYMNSGFPPTPIAMPSEASIHAAANPDRTPYYYFVATGKGGHTFSRNLAEHNKAVRHYVESQHK